MPPYVNPVPRQRLGRTDQGVDIAAPPGTPVLAIADERLLGILPNWFKGQPFYYFQELGSGVINYVAEQFRSNLKVGQTVRAGQQIGTVAQSGTGLELGFAKNRTAAAAGHPTPTYTEGQVTALGQRYRAQVFGGKGGYVAPRSTIVAASVYGGPGDPSSGSRGYRGDDLTKHPNTFAELSKNPSSLDFSALGNLPYMTPVTVTDISTGRSVTVYKRDVGAGGAGLSGHPRSIDIWYKAAQQIGLTGVGLVRISVGNAGGVAGGPFPVTLPGGGSPITRPGGQGVGQGAGPDVTQVLSDWTDSQNAPPPTSGDSLNPFNLFRDLSGAVNGVGDFLKLLAWIINPVNILRMVEFLVGLTLMSFGFQAMLQAYGEGKEGFVTSEGSLSRSGLGRVSREVAHAARTAGGPEARAATAGASTARKSTRRLRPEAAPHRTRRQALRLRYEREKKVSQRRASERRKG